MHFILQNIRSCSRTSHAAGIFLGLPLLNWTGREAMVQRQFATSRAAFKTWYEQEAFTALGQSVGRMQRFYGDFGVIILVGGPAHFESVRSSLPRWVSDAWVPHQPGASVRSRLHAFWRSISADVLLARGT